LGLTLTERVLPVLTVLIAIVALWYVFAVILNAPVQRDMFARAGGQYTTSDLIAATLAQERPVLPAPHQIAHEIWQTTYGLMPTS
jgi:NitT/TauT family transport system permease protein